MTTNEYAILPVHVIQEIENIIGKSKLVYVIAFDSDGNDTPLIREDAKYHKISPPIYTRKFTVDSLSYSSFMDYCEMTLDETSFSLIDDLLYARQKILLAFDVHMGVTAFKRVSCESYDFSMDIKSRSIAYGIFVGSCCFYYKKNGHNVPYNCINVPCSQCLPPMACF